MGNITINDIDDDILERLRIRAAKHEVSLEEEARSILLRALGLSNQKLIPDSWDDFFDSEVQVSEDFMAERIDPSTQIK